MVKGTKSDNRIPQDRKMHLSSGPILDGKYGNDNTKIAIHLH